MRRRLLSGATRIVLIAVLVVALGLLGLNTPAGFALIGQLAALGHVTIEGLDGRFPDRLTARRFAVADADGTWLEATGVVFDWAPSALLRATLRVDEVGAETLTVRRFPADTPGAASPGVAAPPGLPALPVAVEIARLHLGAAALPGATGRLEAALRLTGSEATVTLDATADTEAAGPATLHARLEGPLHAVVLDARASIAGQAIDATGLIDLPAPTARLVLMAEDLRLADAQAGHASVTAQYGVDGLTIDGGLAGLRLPGGATPQGLDLALHAEAGLPNPALHATFRLTAPDLGPFAPDLAGAATLEGAASGQLDNLALAATLSAHLRGEALEARLTASGLPDRLRGDITARTRFENAAAFLAAGAVRGADGAIHVVLTEADWNGVSARAALALAPADTLPTGTITLDARNPAGMGGAATATIDLVRGESGHEARVTAEAANLRAGTASLRRATLAGTVTNLPTAPVLDATLTLDAAADRFIEAIRIDAKGPANALGLRLSGSGAAALAASATLDAGASRLALTAFSADAQGHTLRLAAPTALRFAPDVTLDRTRLTLDAATLDLAGRVAPTLDLTARLQALPASLAQLIDPTIQAKGTLQADATLRGTTVSPTGRIHLAGTGLGVATAPLPPTSLTADATLNGSSAVIAASLEAGPTNLKLAGTVPIGPGATNLRATGHADLALLDPILTPAGRRARGTVALDASLTGNPPRPAGTLTLTHGSYTDLLQGIAITGVSGQAHATPDRLVLDRLTGTAGPGSFAGQGSLALAAPHAVDLHLTATNATPLASDALSVRLDSNLSLTGGLDTALAAAGTIHIDRAEIRIPDRLPAAFPTLRIRETHPPPAPPPPTPITLDIAIDAADQVFVHGRGIDAELAGKLHIGGTAADPKPSGGFALRQGRVGLAGQALTFTTGTVDFDGHLPIDPRLNFVATGLGTGVVATLTIAGNASNPSITLSSSPELPQDEVLAQLLFHRSASSLGPFQLAQIATGLAQLADIGGAASFDPLGKARQRLGLDVLTVNENPGQAASIEAGRVIARGVYVGARQSTSGAGSQAVIRLDLAPGLRLEGDIGQPPPPTASPTPGAPPTGNQLRMTYEFEY